MLSVISLHIELLKGIQFGFIYVFYDADGAECGEP